MSIFAPNSNKSSRIPIALTTRRLLDPVTYLACRIGFKSFSRHRKTVLECRDVRLTRKKKSGRRGRCGSVSIFKPKSNKSSRMPIALTIRRLLDTVTYLACRIGFKSCFRHRKTVLEC